MEPDARAAASPDLASDAEARGAGIAEVRGIVAATAEALERRLYRYEELCERFCSRSAAELEAEGHLHFATPCHDLTTVALARLQAGGFRPTPVLTRIHRLLQPVKYQCGLELAVAGEPWYVGFSVTTNRVAPGRFVPVKSRTHVYRAELDAAPPGSPFLRWFGIGHPRELDGFLPGHALARHLKSYRSTTRLRAFDRARRRAMRKPEQDPTLVGPGRWRPVTADAP